MLDVVIIMIIIEEGNHLQPWHGFSALHVVTRSCCYFLRLNYFNFSIHTKVLIKQFKF